MLASGGRRRNRPTRGTRYARPRQWAHAAPLGPPAAALLGANPWGPVELMLDRFAMRSTGTRMRASGLRRYKTQLIHSVICGYCAGPYLIEGGTQLLRRVFPPTVYGQRVAQIWMAIEKLTSCVLVAN